MITKEDEVECITEKPKFIRADKVKQTFQEILKEIKEHKQREFCSEANAGYNVALESIKEIIKSHIPPEWSKDEMQVCGGELKPKIDSFKQNGELKKMKEKFRRQFNKEFPEPEGYNCIVCGACYDEHFVREKWNIGRL